MTLMSLRGHHDDSKSLLGFWVYLMTDCMLFASLFATFVVLRGNTAGGPSGGELFDLPFVLTETLILLASSFTAGIALLFAHVGNKRATLAWLIVTLVLGVAFLAMELTEFRHLIHDGYTWQRSGFLSAFFTLLGVHGLHIAAGLLWGLVLVVRIAKQGLSGTIKRQFAMWSMFWHFLDVIWVFIFTIVYLAGAL